jgi:hypothetical protein
MMHLFRRKPTDSTRDWPNDLRRSEARDTLACQLYVAACKWTRQPADWTALPVATRQRYRDLALENLEKLATGAPR